MPSFLKLIREIEGLINDEPFIKDCISDLLKSPDETFLNDLKSVLKSFVSTEYVVKKYLPRITKNAKWDCQWAINEAINNKDPMYIESAKQTLAQTIEELEATRIKLEKFEAVFQKLSKLNPAFIPQLKIYLKPLITLNQKENPKTISSRMARLPHKKAKKAVRFERTFF